MAGRIRDEDVALVRERSPIADVVGEHLQLRSAGGGELKGLCPFHEERSPSFHVAPQRGFYHCFGCGEGGDVITFVTKMELLSFAEAIERLAQRAGIELRYEHGGAAPSRQHGVRTRLVEAHRAAEEFFAGQLTDSAEAAIGREFLHARGFDLTTAAAYGVGYAPQSWDTLVRHLAGLGFSREELLAGGLASAGRQGPIDRFRGRLVWPIRDITGDTIGFGARRLHADDTGPKYLNTPETPLFRKSTVLYGADLAKREIAARRQAVIVEGYTDVMACHLAGVGTAVATSGTSFGDGHIKILRRLLMDADQFRGEVIFTFDGDAAGQRAVLRAFDLEEHFVTQTFVAVQRDGLDPCDLRLKQGEQAVRDLIAQRLPVFEFAIRSELAKHNLDTNEGRLAALDAAARIIGRIKDRGLRDRYAVSLDRWLGMLNEEFVLARVREHENGQDTRRGTGPAQARGGSPGRGAGPARGTGPGGAPARTAPGRDTPDGSPYDASDPVVNLERQALKLAIQRPALCGPVFDMLQKDDFSVPVHGSVRELIAGCGGVAGAGTDREWAARLIDAAPNDRAREFVTRLAVEPVETPRADGEADVRYAEEVLARVAELAVSRQISTLKSRLQRLNPTDSQSDYNRAFGDLVALEQRRKALLERASGAL